jgi:LppP/LprE lipoprotein
MQAMRRGLSPMTTLVAGLLLGGCGSATKTVTAASTPAPAGSVAQTTATTAPPQTSTSTPPANTTPAQTNGGTSAPTTTRTAPEPAFTRPAASAEGLSGALAVLRARGFTADDTSEYHTDQALRVLLGTRAGSGYGQQAFFFVNGRYIGTDSKQPSASIRVVSQSDTEVTLAYSLSSSSGAAAGQANVRFQLDNGKLTPLDPLPPVSSQTGPARQ